MLTYGVCVCVDAQSNEMRHVVDFFSMIFGLCGIKTGADEAACDGLDDTQRRQLSNPYNQQLASPPRVCRNIYPQ